MRGTFALQPLAKEAFQQPLAELADGGTSVRVDGEGVRDFDSTQDHLLHPDGTSTQQGVALPSCREGALREKEEWFHSEGESQDQSWSKDGPGWDVLPVHHHHLSLEFFLG